MRQGRERGMCMWKEAVCCMRVCVVRAGICVHARLPTGARGNACTPFDNTRKTCVLMSRSLFVLPVRLIGVHPYLCALMHAYIGGQVWAVPHVAANPRRSANSHVSRLCPHLFVIYRRASHTGAVAGDEHDLLARGRAWQVICRSVTSLSLSLSLSPRVCVCV